MDYLITTADGLTWAQLAPFVRSARTFAPAAHLVMFVHNLDESTRATLRAHQVQLQPFDALFPEGRRRSEWVRRTLWFLFRKLHGILRYRQFRQRLLERLGGLLLPRNQARFFTFRAFVESCLCAGDRALFCDARDLVFQSDPFALLPATGFILTQESGQVCLRDNCYNARWLTETYGAAGLARIGHLPVVCAGTFGGERNALLARFDLFAQESLRHPIGYGADQAILNFLHGTGLADAVVLPNEGSLARHVYGLPDAEIRLDAAGNVTDPQGYVYPIVHMYDRYPHLDAAVRARWPST